MSGQRLFAITACALGILFAAVTPPFKVPDESNHFFRAEAIARGRLAARRGAPDAANIPQGLKTLVFVVRDLHDFRMARVLPLEPVKEPRVEFPAFYTPLPYVPQALAAAACNAFNVRPLIAFYAGRLATLAAAIALLAAAMRVAPALDSIIAAVALLPMSLFLFASWSADAVTIALAILMTAMVLADREVPLAAMTVTALALSLCKPAYFLIPLMILITSKSRGRIASVIGATAVGTAVSFLWAHITYFPQRRPMPVDAAEQLRCILAEPIRFARVELHDLALNGASYIEQMIGRLGLMDVKLPPALTLFELLLLVAAGITGGVVMSRGSRAMAMVIVIASVFGIVLTQYLVWSVICGDTIEGVQGRYFLPVLPLALAVISVPRIRWGIKAHHFVGLAAVCDVVALAILWRTWW